MSSTQPPAADDHLPARLTELVGRERDVAAACASRRQDVRLLTLTGAGGIGKTRLAVAIANTLRSEFADGVCLVSLAPITDPDLVVSTIAHALGLRDGDARSPWDRLTDHLRGRRRLLVLDNFEQVAAAAHLTLCRLREAIAGRTAGGGLAVRGVENPALNSATYESPPGLGNGQRWPQPRSNRVVMLLSGG